MIMQTQEEDEWCWAAVAASVDHYFSPGSTKTQCAVAQDILHPQGITCCQNKDDCDVPQRLQDALTDVQHLEQPPVLGALSFPQVQAQINAGFPVCVRIQWPGGGGHFVAIDGYGWSPAGNPQVHVVDPLSLEFTMDYSDLVSAYQSVGTWSATFLVKK
jgi:hypothetical protein